MMQIDVAPGLLVGLASGIHADVTEQSLADLQPLALTLKLALTHYLMLCMHFIILNSTIVPVYVLGC